MQLTQRSQARFALLTASCALLGVQAQADDWQFDSAVMYYGETDRVTALEGILSAKSEDGDGNTFAGKFVVDALTGASANGAVPQASAQTFTRPSGNGQYTAEANEVPLDDTFRDTRVQLSGQWSKVMASDHRLSYGFNASNEYDYRSISANAGYARELNQKNTTLSLGIAYAMDEISPVGGKPLALSAMVVDNGQFASEEAFDAAFATTRDADSTDTKTTFDVLLGYTQVMNRRWITQFNLGFSQVDGYQTDPYKVVSIVDDAGLVQENLYESRPDSRSKTSAFAQSKYYFSWGVWDVSYRFTHDDWGIDTHTLENRWRFPIGEHHYLEPHLRWYQQSAADFYTPFIMSDAALGDYASADYRIGEMTATTLGIKWGWQLSGDREFTTRLEWYQQQPQDSGMAAPGVLSGMDLYPEVDALVLQFAYRF